MSEKPRHPEKVNKPINPIKKKPDWIRSKIVDSQVFFQTKKVVNQNNLVTVCQEANCPNITECWSKKHATFMIMGDTCTRACAFCDVKTGKPTDLDIFEPTKISKAVKDLNLKHVVITSVDRDDLKNDYGASIWAETINQIHDNVPGCNVEVLTPDFKGHRPEDIAASAQAHAELEIEKIMQKASVYGKNLCYAGGVALNCVANSKIAHMFDKVWIFPNPGDAGASLGCALAHNKRQVKF